MQVDPLSHATLTSEGGAAAAGRAGSAGPSTQAQPALTGGIPQDRRLLLQTANAELGEHWRQVNRQPQSRTHRRYRRSHGDRRHEQSLEHFRDRQIAGQKSANSGRLEEVRQSLSSRLGDARQGADLARVQRDLDVRGKGAERVSLKDHVQVLRQAHTLLRHGLTMDRSSFSGPERLERSRMLLAGATALGSLASPLAAQAARVGPRNQAIRAARAEEVDWVQEAESGQNLELLNQGRELSGTLTNPALMLTSLGELFRHLLGNVNVPFIQEVLETFEAGAQALVAGGAALPAEVSDVTLPGEAPSRERSVEDLCRSEGAVDLDALLAEGPQLSEQSPAELAVGEAEAREAQGLLADVRHTFAQAEAQAHEELLACADLQHLPEYRDLDRQLQEPPDQRQRELARQALWASLGSGLS